MMGIAVSWGVHLYALAVIPLHLLSNSLLSVVLFYGAYLPVAILAMTSLYVASTTDPGAVPLGARPLVTVRRAGSMCSNDGSAASGGSGNNNRNASSTATSSGPSPSSPTQQPLQPPRTRAMRRCHKCQDNFKPPRAHHDSVTGRCIVKFDHFCPWVNNAIGALNHKFFCLFLLYTAINCLLSLLLLFLRVVHCGYVKEEEAEPTVTTIGQHQQQTDPDDLPLTEDGQRRFLKQTYVYEDCNEFYGSHLVLALFVVSLVFLIFTCAMGFEQLEAIETGKGKIARMKMRVGDAGTEFSRVTESFNEMFGGDSPDLQLHWLNPFRQVRFPRGMKKVVLGYEWDESMHSPFQDPSSSSEEEEEDSRVAITSGRDGGDRELQDLEMGGNSLTMPTTANRPPPAIPGQPGLVHRASSDNMSLASDSQHQEVGAGGVKNRRTAGKDLKGTMV